MKTRFAIIVLFVSLMIMTAFSSVSATDGAKMNIVATIFPEYDWVRAVLGEKADQADVTLLLGDGVDLHSFQPTVDDIIKVSSCDLFIYVGGESDAWVADALKESINKDMIAINLLETLGDSAKEEELVEGMQGEEEHEHEHEEGEEHEEEPEYDEHVWLSLRNTQILVSAIADAISNIDPSNADIYSANAEAYDAELAALDQDYQKVVEGAAFDTLLFGDRFPFRYMVDDYGLNYYAAFVGCSAESEASFQTIAFLAKKLDETGLNTVLTIENSDHRIAETIIANTAEKDQQILSMNSLQSVTMKDVDAGETYLGIMQDNLDVLKEALN